MFQVVHLPVEEHRGSLGAVTVFVDVRRDGGDTGNPEIEGRNLITEPFHEGQQETAEAAVHVEGQVMFLRHLTQFGNGIDDPVRVGGRRTDDEDRVSVDQFLHRFHVDPHIFP